MQENPTAPFAAKYCAARVETRPTAPKSIITPHIFRIYPRSPVDMPLSIIAATTKGTISSNAASKILKKGAEKASARYPRKYFSSGVTCMLLPKTR